MTKLNKKNLNFGHILLETSLARPEAELLLSNLLKKNREFILTHPEVRLSPALYKKFQALEAKRLNSWPLAYLIGHKEFYGLDFRISPAVLTPRPETEMMVDEVMDMLGKSGRGTAPRPALIVDLGTGSGAIVVAIASEMKRLNPLHLEKIDFRAVDISSPALKIARLNARRHDLKAAIKFYHGDLLTPLKLTPKKLAGREVIITANLPYLTPAQIKRSPSISREPRLALVAGMDGLKYYRELLQQLATRRLGQTPLTVLMEIDPSQTLRIKKLTKKFLPASEFALFKDLAGRSRLVKVTISE